ncbi:MAG TPA: hypothetical protein VI504_04115 [Candidatus Eisenbacteria bacterium]|jgi:hypothetical protein
MNRLLLRSGLVAAMLSLLASAAFAVPAPGLNLAWNNCASQGGVQNMAFTCDDDGLQETLVGTFVLTDPIAGVTGVEVVLDLISSTATLPAWWDLGTGGCAEGDIAANAVAPTGTLCRDWAVGSGQGGLAAYGNPPGTSIAPADEPAHRRVLLAFAVAAAKNLVIAREYFTFNLNIQTAHTVAGPPGPCTGCLTPVCIVLNSVNVVPGTNAGTLVGNPSAPLSNQATWQGPGGNCAAVPVKNATWGQVKALYR